MVDEHRTFVIVGAGLAGARAAETLRAEGFGGRVILVGDERDRPYERPPLSKGFLTGAADRSSVFVHDPAWYAQAGIELHLGQPATRLDPLSRTVVLADGTPLTYDRLLLATGAEPRRPDVPGTGLAGVHRLRRLSDAERLRGALAARGQENGHLVIAGAGWIGLEVAAAARGYGVEVTVIEPEPTPLHSALGPELGSLFADLHREHGVRFHFGARAAEIVGHDGTVWAVRTDDGEEHPAHEVLLAVGAAPRTALAEAAGLALAGRDEGGGIAVDASLRTSDPYVFAVGDVASAEHPLFGRRLRTEHWANANDGGPAAARAMLGWHVSYDPVPYFFSDQYDLGMEFCGHAPPGAYDQVVCRGDMGKREFIAFWLSQGRVLAGMNVNVWEVNERIQQLVRSGAQVDPDRLADPGVPLESLAP
ncbi:NAD(P)/FAD-dependent oxidoreductase [Streptomyces sp. SCUT-3]|uniref:NAD(P)/FAD-dependent oxidoreductase n=1 Tax=Streptomyces sp. SCUT-3 TaxID=2684469 RepID=UPI000CA788EA|nr:FAD-dependent oxidoreductase [Streptomyces sp. SCUT-3]PLW72203.1 FAD-dependent oxidoreductase [Streptomyces sp. DJ]QMV23562.1 NAD(P)/FAD-dependent oxidoreductase [Streptomyces sp. SCUT-3]